MVSLPVKLQGFVHHLIPHIVPLKHYGMFLNTWIWD